MRNLLSKLLLVAVLVAALCPQADAAKRKKNLVETYAVNIDPALHKEVKERYAALNLKPYGGFLNPEIVPVKKGLKVVDYKIVYADDFLEQMMEYGRKYSTL